MSASRALAHAHAGVRRVLLLRAAGHGDRRPRQRVAHRAARHASWTAAVRLRALLRPRPAPAREHPALRADRRSAAPRREPAARPASSWSSVATGTRSGAARAPAAALVHEPAGGGLQPTGEVALRARARLAEQAEAEGAELALRGAPGRGERWTRTRLQRLARPPGWPALPDGIVLGTPGTMDVTVHVPAEWPLPGLAEAATSRARSRSPSTGAASETCPTSPATTATTRRPIDVRPRAGPAPAHALPRRRRPRAERRLARASWWEWCWSRPILEAPEMLTMPSSSAGASCATAVDWIEVVRSS